MAKSLNSISAREIMTAPVAYVMDESLPFLAQALELT